MKVGYLYVVTHFYFGGVEISACRVFPRRFAARQAVFEVAEYFGEYRRAAHFLAVCGFWFLRVTACQLLRFDDGFALGIPVAELVEALHVHYKVYHVQALAVRFAVAAKTISRFCFWVNLKAWRFVRMERAAQAVVPVGM